MSHRFRRLAVLFSLPAALAALLVLPAQAEQRRLPRDNGEVMLSFAPVVQETAPAVVNVYATRMVARRRNPFEDDPFFRRFFGGRGFGVPQERAQASLGSGVLVSADGIVVTNNHVVADATEIKIALADRREFEADIIVKDERTDLAVLRVRGAKEKFAHLELGDSDALQVGDIVLAIGNPFGVGQTVTNGIVSALARSGVGVTDYQSFIQTDAPINPGNSGGALVDMAGRLIGINTAIFSRSGGSHGIGFAIPANMVRLVVESVKTGGVVRRPWFGARVQAVTAEIAQSMGLARPVGVLVVDVTKNGPADKAGLRIGDLVTSVAGQEIADLDGFGYRFSTQGIGGKAELGIIRNGKEMTSRIVLEAAPEVPPRDETLLKGRHPLAGARVVNLSPAVAEELRVDPEGAGVVVSEIAPGSPAATIGLVRGDAILDVNGEQIENVRMLQQTLAKRAYRWRLVIDRGGQTLTMVLGG